MENRTQTKEEWLANYAKKEEARKAREQGYAEIVRKSRTGKKEPITIEKVINGLKFIAEHQSISQEELIYGLLELGCNFSLEDIKQQFPEKNNLYDGMKQGKIGSGASVIANVRDDESARDMCDDRFLGVDDDSSIYHFIRVATGDKTYTKEMVDALNNTNKKHR